MINSRLGFGDLHLIFKVTAGLKLPNLSPKVLVCTISHELVGRFQPDLHGYKIGTCWGTDLIVVTLTYFSRSVRELNCQIWAKKCLCAQYLMNQMADFNQICMDITFGHDKKLNRLWWPLSNFQGHCQTLSTKIKPKRVSLHVISWTIGWNVTEFASLYKSDRINSLLDFGDLDLIFKVTASWLKLPPLTGLGGWGHLFSLKSLLYFNACLAEDINSLLSQSKKETISLSPSVDVMNKSRYANLERTTIFDFIENEVKMVSYPVAYSVSSMQKRVFSHFSGNLTG